MIDPFLKWAGGKRWLVNQHQPLFPIAYNRYVEPFLGSGAVYFSLQPSRALLSDTNAELINVYKMLRDYPGRIHQLLCKYHSRHTAEFYYQLRGKQHSSGVREAARLLYLNRVCFNGLYRVNLKGEFNVPLGTKTAVSYPPGYLRSIANLLKRARILCSDFENVVDRTEAGDFLYIDPPYSVMHNNNNFLKYNDVLFSWDDQTRLAACLRRASRRGVLVLISNANHPSIRELYRGFGRTNTLSRASLLAGDSDARRSTTEVAIYNYEV
jgi:DNA adenine methylase